MYGLKISYLVVFDLKVGGESPELKSESGCVSRGPGVRSMLGVKWSQFLPRVDWAARRQNSALSSAGLKLALLHPGELVKNFV